MKLHRLHIAERGDAGLQRDGRGNAFGDHRIGGHSIEPSSAAAGNCGGLGDISGQLSSNRFRTIAP